MRVRIVDDQRSFLDHYYVRGTVFIVEQQIDWTLEFDGDDYRAVLFVLYDEETPIGAARLVDNKPGRVAVLEAYRRKGAGRALMDAVEHEAQQRGVSVVELGAQKAVIPFYERLGYTAYGPTYLDAGIEHRMMKKDLRKEADHE